MVARLEDTSPTRTAREIAYVCGHSVSDVVGGCVALRRRAGEDFTGLWESGEDVVHGLHAVTSLRWLPRVVGPLPGRPLPSLV